MAPPKRSRSSRMPSEDDGGGGDRCLTPALPSLTASKVTSNLWAIIGIGLAFIVVLQCLLVQSYASTDMEVHRNWMAVTYHEPLSRWYYNNVSEWTLDYPPFFAYFERGLASIAAAVDPAYLTVQSDPLLTEPVVLFQRLSVISVFPVYVFGAYCLARAISTSEKELAGLLLILAANPTLIILDNMHFQYNAMLYGFLLMSVAAIASNRLVLGGFLFAVLLNFKHLYLYYVPGYVIFYLKFYLFDGSSPSSIGQKILRLVKLALAVGTPLAASFGPFLIKTGVPGIQQIISRLFPFKRGLTHAYWAPNFWALYNAGDYALYQILRSSKGSYLCRKLGGVVSSCNPLTPIYTSGLVVDFTHSVLPGIAPGITLACTVLALVSMVFVKRRSQVENFLCCIAISGMAFFYFGWHVHEKALLMVYFPIALLAFVNPSFFHVFIAFSILTPAVQFPLIFSAVEHVSKYTIAILGVSVVFGVYRWWYYLSWHRIVRPSNALLLATVVAVEGFHHYGNVIFADTLPFLPLMVTSVTYAVVFTILYAAVLSTIFYEFYWTHFDKPYFERWQAKIANQHYSDKSPKLKLEKVKFVGGLDISTVPDNSDVLVASYTIVDFETLKTVYTADEIFLQPQPYVPEFLFLREGPIFVDLVSAHRHIHPVDVILIDGNGWYHSKLAGCACHVGDAIGIPTIGVAKSLATLPLESFEYTKTEIDDFVTSSQKVRSLVTGEALSVQFVKELSEGLAIIRPPKKTTFQFVSPGMFISMEDAVKIVTKTLIFNVPEPIRISDLRSRMITEQLF